MGGRPRSHRHRHPHRGSLDWRRRPRSEETVPRLQYQPLCPVFAELAHLAVLQHPERLAWIVRPRHIRGVEDVAQFVAPKAVQVSVVSVQLSAKSGTAPLIPAERRTAVAE